MARPRLKICCIGSLDEAQVAIEYGANALGLVGEMPSGPGVIRDSLAREIADAVPPGIDTFLLTSRERGSDIVDHVQHCGTTSVQIVKHIDPAEYETIMRHLPNIRRIQVIHVEDEDVFALMNFYQPFIHAFLLDSGRPKAAIAELGGTGRQHDWDISARFVQQSAKPVFLAGGLRAGNIRAAVSTVAPYGVDLCSGIRTNDTLDEDKLREFVRQLNHPTTVRRH